ncbi:hypothetical protein PLICRDRAFT_41720 [Plicaturopsis crispa FD-325 SS-3]|nr:hypothetical protein PLICRDRAFT_41720 [Plicaturopsis crispa FD-325 SS-3]
MNIKTLQDNYPTGNLHLLSASQVLSLHLLLNRPAADGESPDPLFGPYISVLPRDFDSHPLSWLVKRRSSTVEDELVQSLPPSTLAALEKLHAKFSEDWRIVREYMATHPEVSNKSDSLESHLINDFVWAWLNVNTRCIYHRLKDPQSHPDNFTLCPVLDFANHTAHLPHMLPLSSDAEIWNIAPRRRKAAEDFTLLSPSNAIVPKGQELYLTYGLHCNRTLFVEYGFINDAPQIPSIEMDREVEVQDLVEWHIRNRPTKSWIEETLRDEGYWGDWTMHTSPAPAHPSFRLVAALRLLHIDPSAELDDWRDTLMGRRDTVSDANEEAWRRTLVDICDRITERAQRRPTISRRTDAPPWFDWACNNIRLLWDEEVIVASAVTQSIRDGEQF